MTEQRTITKEIKIVCCPTLSQLPNARPSHSPADSSRGLLRGSTKSQLADCMTKPLFGRLLQRMTAWILGWAPHPGPSATTADDRD